MKLYDTPLHNAAYEGNVEEVRLLIEGGADVDSTDEYDKRTPLSITPHIEVANILIRHGAIIDAKSRDGWTALHYAASRGLKEKALLLIRHGADIDSQCTSGSTPLLSAVVNERRDMIELLIKHGADVNIYSNGIGTPLQVALRNIPDIEIVKLLVKAGADINMTTDGARTSPIDYCIEHKMDNYVNILRGIPTNQDRPMCNSTCGGCNIL